MLETTQDIEKLEKEIIELENHRNEELNQMEESFEQKKIRQLS